MGDGKTDIIAIFLKLRVNVGALFVARSDKLRELSHWYFLHLNVGITLTLTSSTVMADSEM